MSLDDVSVEPAVHKHGAFEVYEVAGSQKSEVGTLEGLPYGGDYVGAVGIYGDDGEAYAVVRHRLVDVQLSGEGATDGEVDIRFYIFNCHNLCGFFNYS